MATLFDSMEMGALRLPNRIIMAPMTRARGTRDHLPTAMMADYYAQRAGAGLIISEAIGITQQGLGWPYATGLWARQQIDGWRRVTAAVHGAGGRIIAQLWHMGRVVHPSFLGGEAPVSASATLPPGLAYSYDGRVPFAPARSLTPAEISAIADDFARAADNAMLAGFDGVQLHAANGYLIDQFLRDGSNLRTDEYGGSVEGRVRFLSLVTNAVARGVGPDRTGVRLSPNGELQGVADSAPVPLFTAALQALSAIGIAHVELREPPMDGTFGTGDTPPLAAILGRHFTGRLILNSDFTVERAKAELAAGVGDAVAFGRPFIANPNFPERAALGLPLAQDDPATWFTQGPEGYIDYP